MRHQHRWEVINALIARFGYKSYLEIGVRDGACFHQVVVAWKKSVDLASDVATVKMESDRYFMHYEEYFDIIFIDGCHERDQVLRDLGNSLKFLSDNGTIIVHDCNPVKKEHTDPLVNGTVWEAWVHYRMHRSDLCMVVLDTDQGCGVIRRGHQELFPLVEEMNFDFLDRNRERLLNLVAPVWPDWLDNNFR